MIRAVRLTTIVPRLACGLLLGTGTLTGMLLQVPPSATLSQLAAASHPRHATMTVGEVDMTVQWYQEKLGFARLDLRGPDGKTARVLLVGRRNVIELRSGTASVRSLLKARANLPEIALQLDDVDTETAELKERGVEIVAEPRYLRSRHMRISLIRDVNGHTIELQQPL